MTAISISNFTGESPRIDARLLPENGAQIAENCDLRSGKIVPRFGHTVAKADIPSSTKTIYLRKPTGWIAEWGDGFFTDWRVWANYTYYFESPFAKETKSRLYTLDFVGNNVTEPMQYQGIGIPQQDLFFEAPEETPVSVSIDRNDPANTLIEITCKGSDIPVEEEIIGSTLTASFDGVICVGSANPSNNIVNGNDVTFDYNVKTFTSADGDLFTETSSTVKSYSGKILYAGGDTMFVNPAITETYTSGGAAYVKISVDAEDNLITAQSTGDSLPPAGEILDRYYLFTEVYENGEESPPSEESNLATIYKGDVAELSNIGSAIPKVGVVKKRIYTTSGGIFKVLGEIEPNETTFTDNVATTKLFGELLVANNPPSMIGMIISPLGFTVGWEKRDIHFANEYLPYAWDDDKTITVKYNIVGMIAVNDIIYVMTEGAPYILSGFTISSMTLEEIPEPQSCISKSGITRYKNSAFYISPDGIVRLSGGNSQLYTKNLFDKRLWNELQPERGALSVHDDELHFTTPIAHYKFSLSESNVLTRGDIYSDVVYADIKTDSLYFLRGTDIMLYDAGTTKLVSRWRSKVIDYMSDQLFNVGKVVADSYNDLTYNVYADGAQVASVSVSSNNPFRLPRIARAKTWEIEIVGTDTVSNIQLAQTMVEIT